MPRIRNKGPIWNRESRELLAENLKNFPCLWNMNDFYTLESKRDAYDKLVKKLQNSVPDVDIRELKRQIKNERDYFRAQKAMVDRTQQIGDEPYVPGWFLWETYQYLVDGMQQRTVYQPVQRVVLDDDEDDDEYTAEYSDSHDDTLFIKQNDKMTFSNQPVQPYKKQKRNDTSETQYTDVQLEQDTPSEHQVQVSTQHDEWDIFAMDIANDLRRLPDHTRWQAKCSIRRLVEDLVAKTMQPLSPPPPQIVVYGQNYSSELRQPEMAVDTKPVITEVIPYTGEMDPKKSSSSTHHRK